MKKNRADILVIGGGPSGLAVSASLGAAGFSVICLEREMPRAAELKAAKDGRTTALSWASAQILKKSGVWKSLEKNACPILDIRVADGDSSAHLDFHHREAGNKPFGWIVENHLFRRALHARIKTLKNVALVSGAVMDRFEADGYEARAILNDGSVFTASLAIAADGRGSRVRAQAGIETYGWAYGQTAIACTIAHELPHQNIAVEHFLPGGPLATLPMTGLPQSRLRPAHGRRAQSSRGHRSSIVWTEKTEVAKELMALDDGAFTQALEDKVRDWLGTVELAGPRAAYPLKLQHARHYTSKRLALIGDAAHGIHPIAGQGFNLGMGDIGALAEETERAAALGLDLGDGTLLRAFEKNRRTANGNMVLATDLLDRLFSNSIAPIEAARRFGLGAVQRLPALKRFFMKTAMGRAA